MSLYVNHAEEPPASAASQTQNLRLEISQHHVFKYFIKQIIQKISFYQLRQEQLIGQPHCFHHEP